MISDVQFDHQGSTRSIEPCWSSISRSTRWWSAWMMMSY